MDAHWFRWAFRMAAGFALVASILAHAVGLDDLLWPLGAAFGAAVALELEGE